MKLCTPETMRRLDQRTIEEIGIPGLLLMEKAGEGAFQIMADCYAPELDRGVAVVCGPGNNGGDGLVVARLLHHHGFEVRVYLMAGPEKLKGDVAVNYAIGRNLALDMVFLDTAAPDLAERLAHNPPGLLVDALFGTGLNRPPRQAFRRVIEEMNASGIPILALDVPSGLDALSGQPLESTVKAAATVTFGLAKIGLVQDAALEYVGDLFTHDIGIPSHLVEEEGEPTLYIEEEEACTWLPPRPLAGHKGRFGHVFVVAGSLSKPGAGVLAAHAALKSGAGLVTLGVPATALRAGLPGLWPEIMLEALPDGGRGVLGEDSIERVIELSNERSTLVIGPGLGGEAGVRKALEGILGALEVPALVDADGLNAFAGRPSGFQRASSPLILTPHPGEAARLLDKTSAMIQSDRMEAAQSLADQSGATVVLKGARTIVIDAKGRHYVNSSGNSGMGTAGSGDALGGIIGGLCAQRMPPERATPLGVYLHGLAGNEAAKLCGERSLVASDLIAHLGTAFRRLEEA